MPAYSTARPSRIKDQTDYLLRFLDGPCGIARTTPNDRQSGLRSTAQNNSQDDRPQEKGEERSCNSRIDAVWFHGGMGETLATEIIILAADCWPEPPRVP